jgi:CheY-like chemotaxis protein
MEPNPKRILVVDDDALVRRMVATILKRAGNFVQTAEDGESAWEALRTGTYSLLVTDCNMPRVSGLVLVDRIRSANFALPIIMISGASEGSRAFPDAWSQVDVHLSKPFELTALLTAVTRLLAGHPITPGGRSMD